MHDRNVLRPGKNIGDMLRETARNTLARAHQAIEHGNNNEAEAIHNYRKAMKRWRALVRLLEPFLGDDGPRLRIASSKLAKELAGARDAQAALNALDDVRKEQGALSDRSYATIKGRLEELKRPVETAALSPLVRKRLLAALSAWSASVKSWYLDEVVFDDLADRLAVAYRRVRGRIPGNWSKADIESLHRLRRSVIVHRYQMELVEPLWPKFGKIWVSEAQKIRDRLGAYHDLVVLSGFTGPHLLLAPWRSRLTPPIAARQEVHLAAANRLCERLFAEKPKAFKRRLEVLWETHDRTEELEEAGAAS